MKEQICIPSDLSYLKDVHRFIENFLNKNSINLSKAGFIVLSVCESVNNAIVHGNKSDCKKFVTVKALLQDYHLIIEIEDEGGGFDYKNLPDPTTDENIRNEGGRGLFIIQKLVDEVHFKKKGSIIQLKFNIHSEHQFLL